MLTSESDCSLGSPQRTRVTRPSAGATITCGSVGTGRRGSRKKKAMKALTSSRTTATDQIPNSIGTMASATGTATQGMPSRTISGTRTLSPAAVNYSDGQNGGASRYTGNSRPRLVDCRLSTEREKVAQTSISTISALCSRAFRARASVNKSDL